MIPFEYRTEGYDASRLGWGTTEAKDVTLSFWIKSNRTGIYTVDFTMQGSGTNPFIARQYTINSANTWEYKTITIPAHTTATNVKIDSTNAFSIFWWALSGSTFNSGEIVKPWGAQTPANRAPGTSATIASGDYWQMTGVQLELGKVATPFEHRSYGEELALCQRYYQKFYDEAANTGQVMLLGLASGAGHFTWWPSVEMRARPTVGITDTTPYWESFPWYTVGTSLTVSSISNGHLSRSGGEIGVFGSFNPALVRGTNYSMTGEVIYFDAEL
jgi:hypothetical protein